MKLLQRTNRTYLLFSVLLLIIAGLFLYHLLAGVIEDEITEKLIVDKERIVQKLRAGEPVPHLPPIIEVETLPTHDVKSLSVSDTVLFDPVEEEREPFREVRAIEVINGKSYQITLRHVALESHDYYNSIGLALTIVLLLTLTGLWFINRTISKSLWKPFHNNLKALSNFALDQERPIALQQSTITEFAELNRAIEELTERVRSDYHSMKEFTGNAAHEMQTPLAVIRATLEEALQTDGITREQATLIASAYGSSQRLAKLNQSLLFLAKIENRQFASVEDISLSQAVQHVLESMQELVLTAGLTLETTIDSEFITRAHPMLVDTLLSNLVGNAIKHNRPEGLIRVELRANLLRILNSGHPLEVDPMTLLNRFSKASQSSDSLGLGLSIAQKICQNYNWNIRYTTDREWHILTVEF
ncbi:MAG: HAMP domain-containing histidine kinase [Ignavibacteriae bacterium]|nr:HAMP domain-containing histidine kinase [Ignavibacteriota bacterium]MCB9217322.1 HAMP domain-containing histidine kinase [Ignavibacteria bacterium]